MKDFYRYREYDCIDYKTRKMIATMTEEEKEKYLKEDEERIKKKIKELEGKQLK